MTKQINPEEFSDKQLEKFIEMFDLYFNKCTSDIQNDEAMLNPEKNPDLYNHLCNILKSMYEGMLIETGMNNVYWHLNKCMPSDYKIGRYSADELKEWDDILLQCDESILFNGCVDLSSVLKEGVL